ncbi:hypothetical protein BDY24DRAFT_186214 [Mrakia frigida]|uniref:uncharacterized protein n=1 Tax=Mrakia frigida TaxID=29902 RepID=UPI003FCC1FAD
MATTPFSPNELVKYRIAASIDPSILPIVHPDHFSPGLGDHAILRMLGMAVETADERDREERSVSESSSTRPLTSTGPSKSKTTFPTKERSSPIPSSDSLASGSQDAPTVAEDVKGRRDRKKRDFYDASNYQPSHEDPRRKRERSGRSERPSTSSLPQLCVPWSESESRMIASHVERKRHVNTSVPFYVQTFASLDFPGRTVGSVRRRMERQATEGGISLKFDPDATQSGGLGDGTALNNGSQNEPHEHNDATRRRATKASSRRGGAFTSM